MINVSLFDHFIGAGEQRWQHFQAERLRGFEVDRGRRYWWLVIEDGTVDLCGVDPGYDVDLHVRSSLRSMTAVWMGHSTLQREIDAGAIQLIGDKALARRMHEWLGLSSFAKEKWQIAN